MPGNVGARHRSLCKTSSQQKVAVKKTGGLCGDACQP